jgi:uncharacterized protein
MLAESEEDTMRSDEDWYPGHLRELSETECRELLTEHRVGRVAWEAGDGQGPVVLPVNYRFDGEHVTFRTSPHSVLARSFRRGPKSFQIDDHDNYNQSGWSVLVRGDSEVLEWDELPADADKPTPWVEGNRNVYVRITPSSISGRRVLPG